MTAQFAARDLETQQLGIARGSLRRVAYGDLNAIAAVEHVALLVTPSVGVVAEQRLERTLPFVAPALDQYIGRVPGRARPCGRERKDTRSRRCRERQSGARLEAVTGDRHHFTGKAR